ncbi:prepilin-type N-terminal cleavage/methylation domain-containing protein [Vibrio rhodolitus]|uniref:prepilin-type N-terminal cleavage/methylation domain-containing protein n=1 Tax=Vibrio rhodolitus TaxID=2231649 RepID=UPI000E0A5035|nr:prepilin-type N-terminal cleavage/methylation domain-containing protein [Vibrio rhodolitus]
MNIRKQSGFTLVELIIVIILLTIISLYAASRYIGVGSFSALAIQDSIISIARQVQLNRMQSNLDPSSMSANKSLTLDIANHYFGSTHSNCDRVEVPPLTSAQKAQCLQERESRSDWLRDERVTFSVNPSSAAQIEFDLLGSPIGSASNGVTLTIAGDGSQAMVSICANGFISRSGCN